jgi:hypothetical protein
MDQHWHPLIVSLTGPTSAPVAVPPPVSQSTINNSQIHILGEVLTETRSADDTIEALNEEPSEPDITTLTTTDASLCRLAGSECSVHTDCCPKTGLQ